MEYSITIDGKTVTKSNTRISAQYIYKTIARKSNKIRRIELIKNSDGSIISATNGKI